MSHRVFYSALGRPRSSERSSLAAEADAPPQYALCEPFGIFEQLARPAPWPVSSGGVRP